MKQKIISTFKERPKTKIAWWAMWLGLSIIFSGPILGIFVSVIRPMIDEDISEKVGIALGFLFGITMFILALSALVASVRAYILGERSWVMWTGLVPAILVALFWIFMIVGEFVFPH